MITIPTTELIGGLTDVLPQITDEKSDYAGVLINWDGTSLHFTAYDVQSAATVYWTPGEGAESTDEDEGTPGGGGTFPDVDWGGDDAPWRTWIGVASAKEIVKLFKLPAKLWRFPVALKCSPTGDRLIVEREDGPRVGRTLMVWADPGKVHSVPDVRDVAYAEDREVATDGHLEIAAYRLAAFGNVRGHGVLRLELGGPNEPIGVTMGQRFAGFVYRSGAKGVHRYNVLRDGAGLVTL